MSCSLHAHARQRGHAILLTLIIVFTGVTLLTYGASADVARKLQSDAQTEQALALAKQALIARAVADDNRPGSLPCPDAVTNRPNNVPNDGVADLLEGSHCPSYVGRLPWRTLGIGDLRDASGERLWYALSPNFRDDDSVRIYSDTRGNRTVYSGATATMLTTEAAAIIFAPGTVLAGQVRDTETQACMMSGTSRNLPRELCAGNYLEMATDGTWNNASASGPYMSARAATTFNDSVAILRTSDFIPLVEQRVARELRDVLLQYQRIARQANLPQGRCGHGCFPWPDVSDPTDTSNYGNSDPGQNRGRVPVRTAEPHNWGTQVGNTGYVMPNLPQYYRLNNWQNVIYYTVGKRAVQNSGNLPNRCDTCQPNAELLTVDGVSTYEVVLITPGPVRAGQTRTAWSHYITDPLNHNGDDTYVAPNARVLDRNRLFAIAGNIAPIGCEPNARALLQNAPCHTTGTNIKAVCRHAADNLAVCSCADAAQVLINVPCRNTLAPDPKCADAVQRLQVCTK